MVTGKLLPTCSQSWRLLLPLIYSQVAQKKPKLSCVCAHSMGCRDERGSTPDTGFQSFGLVCYARQDSDFSSVWRQGHLRWQVWKLSSALHTCELHGALGPAGSDLGQTWKLLFGSTTVFSSLDTPSSLDPFICSLIHSSFT